MSAPTPQDISALLRQARLPRSNYGLQATEWDQTTPGFTAWKTRQPDGIYVAVLYTAGRAGDEHTDAGWAAYLRRARDGLEKCAAVLRAAGYPAEIRDRGGEPPWLVIPVTEDGETAG
jgi:hypothetical protein